MCRHFLASNQLPRNQRGSVLIETAFSLPLLILLLCGMLVYGNWFMAAHSLQQAANDAARVSLAGLSAQERRSLVNSSLASSRAGFPLPNGSTIGADVREANGFLTVALRYDPAGAPIFSAIPFPLPATILERAAVVKVDAR